MFLLTLHTFLFFHDQPDKSGRTALHWAAISGHTDIVKFLLSKGANILAETGSKMNALHGAVEGGRVDTVRCLMEHVQNDVNSLKLDVVQLKTNVSTLTSDVAAIKNDVRWIRIIGGTMAAALWYIITKLPS